MRIAWFSPLPPMRSGISAYSVDLLPHLATEHAIDVFVDVSEHPRPTPAEAGLEGIDSITISSAHDFLWRHQRSHYDLIVYQMGNATCHDYMWPYVIRHPGLVVLHDGQLHHSRARRLLHLGRPDDYRVEFAYSHPDVRPAAAEYAVAGHPGMHYYFYPMLRPVVERARLLAVHNARLAADLRATHPGTRIEVVTMGVPDPANGGESLPYENIRRRHGIADSSLLLVAFGLQTPEKRITSVLHAMRATTSIAPDVHLLLVGQDVTHLDVLGEAERFGVADRVTMTGFVDDDSISDYLAAADVCLCLRWPSSRETSASWLRCLAAGRATIVTDLADLVDVPTIEPLGWQVRRLPATDSESDTAEPVAIGVNVRDEVHSLMRAFVRLADDGPLRDRLGRSGRAHWERCHTLDRMLADYRRVLELAATAPDPLSSDLPPHLLTDGTTWTQELLAPFDLQLDFL